MAPGGSLTQQLNLGQFSFDPTQVAKNPDYQFQLNEGLDAVKRAAASTGTLGSSATLKGLTNYAGGVASQNLNADYQRALQTYNTNRDSTLANFNTNRANNLSNITLPLGIGTAATQASNENFADTSKNIANVDLQTGQYTGNQYASQGNNIANLLMQQAQGKAAGSIQQGNIWGGFANKLGADAASGLASLVGIG